MQYGSPHGEIKPGAGDTVRAPKSSFPIPNAKKIIPSLVEYGSTVLEPFGEFVRRTMARMIRPTDTP